MDISVCGATFVGIFSLLSHNSLHRIHLQCCPTLVMTTMVIHFAMCCISAIFALSFLPFLFADFILLLFFWVDTYPNLVNRHFLSSLNSHLISSSYRANLHFFSSCLNKCEYDALLVR